MAEIRRTEAVEIESVTLAALEAEERPSTVCAKCVHGIWFRSEANLQCFCRAMHVVIFDRVKSPNELLECDARYFEQK